MRRARGDGVVVFVGPSLPRAEVLALAPGAVVRGPAAQGDVFRALALRPRVVVLIDGVFEGVPSVWHHELRAALRSGAQVLGAASMGALRAAELEAEGMVPVGTIARAYATGARVDDADVALLHGDAAAEYRALTLPQVNVEATLAAAVRARLLSRPAQARLVAASRGLHYSERQWSGVLAGLPAPLRATLRAWVKVHFVDAKADDARACLRAAVAALGQAGAPPAAFRPSSFVRRRRLLDTLGEALPALEARADAAALAADGTRRLLLAALARASGIEPEEEEVASWLASIPAQGLAEDERVTLAEALALDALVLSAPERFVSDGPGRLEGLVAMARLHGLSVPGGSGPGAKSRAPRRRRR